MTLTQMTRLRICYVPFSGLQIRNSYPSTVGLQIRRNCSVGANPTELCVGAIRRNCSVGAIRRNCSVGAIRRNCAWVQFDGTVRGVTREKAWGSYLSKAFANELLHFQALLLHFEARPDEWTHALGVVVADRLADVVFEAAVAAEVRLLDVWTRTRTQAAHLAAAG